MSKETKKSRFTAAEEETMYFDLGMELIQILGLKIKRNDRVDTVWGDKSPEGLGRTAARIVHEHLAI
jgi:hypothetical protein